MHLCPHCNKPGITTMRKLFLGPAWPATCKQCGQKIGASYAKAYLAAVPLLLAGILTIPLRGDALGIILVITGGIITCILHVKLTPLIKR